MQPYFREEKRKLTPVKAIEILAKYGTIINLESAKVMLEFLYKLSNLSVSEAILRATTVKNENLAKKKNV